MKGMAPIFNVTVLKYTIR